MRNGTITLENGADADIANGVTPELPPPTGSTSSVVQDALAAKSVPLSGAVVVGSANRKVAFFSATAGSLDALQDRVVTGGVDGTLNAEFAFDEDGNLVISEGVMREASANDQAILDEVMAPKPPAYKRFSQLVSAIETAHEKAGRGCAILFDQNGTGSIRVFTTAPATADGAVAAIVATDAGQAATLGNGGAPLAVATIAAGAVASTKLPGE